MGGRLSGVCWQEEGRLGSKTLSQEETFGLGGMKEEKREGEAKNEKRETRREKREARSEKREEKMRRRWRYLVRDEGWHRCAEDYAEKEEESPRYRRLRQVRCSPS